MVNKKISIYEAKTIFIHKQLLNQYNKSDKIKEYILSTIEHLGYIQIDTLNIIERAHHHTLWSRLEKYESNYLNQLLEEKKIFEYWTHALSYLPMKDFRFSLILKKEYLEGKRHWFNSDLKIQKFILERIKNEGALQAKDFENSTKTKKGWFEWKDSKKALEQLFMQGKLMVKTRKNFQKVYDLTERVLPDNIDTKEPTIQEYAKYLIETGINSHGIISEKEIAYLRNSKIKNVINKVLREMEADNEIEKIIVENIENECFFTNKENLNLLETKKINDYIHLISPFDNFLIQRKKIKNLFNFDYIIECYTPEAKRKFGYFSIPILYNNELVGRFDPKADRKNKILYIKSIHFENNFIPTENFIKLFLEKLNDFAIFNNCVEISIKKIDLNPIK
ncbi:MAG: crosslink repair DNA glycosylase YcaQ family protein [Candidatus Sericytochromatia bacterium]